MKTKRNRSISLVTICVFQFFLFSLILLLLYMFINYQINRRLENAFPSMTTLLEYQDELIYDTYYQIPIHRYADCDFVIYGEKGNVLYSTSKKIRNQLSSDDLMFIADYYGNTFYSYSAGIDQATQKKRAYISLYQVDEDDTLSFIDECVLDENYQIIEGSLFGDRTSLTQQEVNLIKGYYDPDTNIEKYEYLNINDEQRTLVFVSPHINETSYERVLNDANQLWLYAIPVIFIIIVIQSFFFSKRVKNAIRQLDEAIVSYQDGDIVVVDEKRMPLEFKRTLENFSDLRDHLEEAKREKDRLYKEKQQLIVDISHDLKTPLTVIQGYAKAFMDGKIDEKKVEKYMTVIMNKTQLAADLLNTLFDYVQMDHPGYQAKLEKADLGEFVKAFLAGKYSEIEDKGCMLEVEIEDKKIMYSFDKKLMTRLLDNLLGNALRYNPKGTVIYVSLVDSEKEIMIRVADNGTGIPEEIAEKAFEPFVTGSSARTSGSGSGLGLSIVKKIVELHHGHIELLLGEKTPYATEIKITLFK